jgi:predicted nucleotidyltransferase
MKRPPKDALALLASRTTRPDPRYVRAVFDRPGVAAAYLFGSLAWKSANPLSDVDLAYLGTDKEISAAWP